MKYAVLLPASAGRWLHELWAWPVGFVVGLLIGSYAAADIVAQALVTLCELVAYRWPWLVLFAVVVISARYGLRYVDRVEGTRARAVLSAEERDRVRREVLAEVSERVRQAERLEVLARERMSALRRLAGRVYEDTDVLQGDVVAFAGFVDHVTEVIGRKSKAIQKEAGAEPVKAAKVIERHNQTVAELAEILDSVSKTFPDLAGALTVLKPLEIAESEPEETGRYDLVYLAQKSGDYQGRTMKYKTKRKRRRK